MSPVVGSDVFMVGSSLTERLVGDVDTVCNVGLVVAGLCVGGVVLRLGQLVGGESLKLQIPSEIHSSYAETLVYTAGMPSRAHSDPKLTTPTATFSHSRGPPLSPLHAGHLVSQRYPKSKFCETPNASNEFHLQSLPASPPAQIITSSTIR